MPSTATHAYLARDVYHSLKKEIKTKIPMTKLDDFITYSNGFDIFFFYKITSWKKKNRLIREFGDYLHRNKTNEVLITLINYVKKTKDLDQFLFLIGLVNHYVADSTIHPFVNYQAKLLIKKNFTDSDAHFVIETYIDNYMIKKKEGSYLNYRIDKTCFNLEYKESVSKMINEVLEEVFAKDNMGKYYFQGIKDGRFFFKVFRYDPWGVKKIFYYVVNPFAKRLFKDVSHLSYNFPLDNDEFYLNLEKKTWYNLTNKKEVYNYSFLELYDNTVKKAKFMIESIYDYIFKDKEIDLAKLLENRSYANGKILK